MTYAYYPGRGSPSIDTTEVQYSTPSTIISSERNSLEAYGARYCTSDLSIVNQTCDDGNKDVLYGSLPRAKHDTSGCCGPPAINKLYWLFVQE